DVIEGEQDSPKAMRVFRIVGCMHRVLIEGNGIGYFDRHRPDLYFDICRAQHAHDFLVEVSHRTRREWEGFYRAITRLQHELVRNEVEVELEGALPVRDR